MFTDTTPQAKRAQSAAYRRMSGEQKWRIALNLSDAMQRLAEQRLAKAHPELTDHQIRLELIRERHGIVI